MNLRRRELINMLPSHNWSIAKAGIKLGYKSSYAEHRLVEECMKDVEFCKAMDAKRKEVVDLAAWNIEELQRQYRKLLQECSEHGDRVTAKGVLDSLTRIQGGFADHLITEDINETKRMDDRERAELCEVVKLRLKDVG
jgi:hypothetical protein